MATVILETEILTVTKRKFTISVKEARQAYVGAWKALTRVCVVSVDCRFPNACDLV